MVVVKVGGSLYDHPKLGPGLRQYLDAIDAPNVLIVAGGGPFADVVRQLDSIHHLGETTAHNMALQAIRGAPSSFLAALIRAQWLDNLCLFEDCAPMMKDSRYIFLDCDGFFGIYEHRLHPIPHSWAVTTDSIAALAAKVANARLILLKSIDIPPGTSWEEAADRGWVDDYFSTAVTGSTRPIEVVNFRRWLDEHFPPAANG